MRLLFKKSLKNGLIKQVNKINFFVFHFARRAWFQTHTDYIQKKAFKHINILNHPNGDS